MTTAPWQCALPGSPRPIAIIGAGGIVNDAHLPAYQIAGFEVVGFYDVDPAKAQATAHAFRAAQVFSSISEMASSSKQLIFDLAVPASANAGFRQHHPLVDRRWIQRGRPGGGAAISRTPVFGLKAAHHGPSLQSALMDTPIPKI